MAVVDTLVLRLAIDKDIDNIHTAMTALSTGILAFQAVATTAFAAGGAVIEFGKSAVEAWAELERYQLGLRSVSRSQEEFNQNYKELRNIAKGPGIGLGESLQSYTDLVAAGIDSRTSKDAIQEFGNALAAVGRTKADLHGALYGLRQMQTAGKVLAQDLNIIKQRVPQVAAILDKAYGTSRAQDLAKMGLTTEEIIQVIIRGLKELPRVMGGVQNDIDNFNDTWQQVMAEGGKSAVEAWGQYFKDLSSALQAFVESGAARSFFDILTGSMPGAGGEPGQTALESILIELTSRIVQLSVYIQNYIEFAQDLIEAIGYVTGFSDDSPFRYLNPIKVVSEIVEALIRTHAGEGDSPNARAEVDGYGTNAYERTKEALEAQLAWDKNPKNPKNKAGSDKNNPLVTEDKKVEDTLRRIEKHAEKTARNTDKDVRERWAVGGAVPAATSIDHRQVMVRVTGMDDDLNTMFQKFTEQLIRQNVLRVN